MNHTCQQSVALNNIPPLQASEKKPPKKTCRTVDLPVETVSHCLSPADLNALVEAESNMAAGDKLENDRINAKVGVICKIIYGRYTGYKYGDNDRQTITRNNMLSEGK